MPRALEIQWVRKSNRFEAHDRIHSVGGVDEDGQPWRLSPQDVVHRIDSGTHTFFVTVGDRRVAVVTATSRWGYRYIKTIDDETQPDTLLELPDFS